MKHLDKGIMEDKLLIERAKAHDERAVEQLYNKYKLFIRSLARKYYLVDGDLDDLIQEGTMAFLNAIATYDEDKNDNFKAYVAMVVDRKLINKIKQSARLKNIPLNEGFALNSQGEVELSDGIMALSNDSLSPEENTISDENIKYIYSIIETRLSKYEKEILDLYLQGHSYTDIAKLLGKTNKSVDNALNRIKNKLQNLR